MTRPLTSLLVLLSLGGAAANDVTQYFRSLPSRIPQCQVDGADGARRTMEHVICVYISPDGGIVQHKDIGRAPGSGKQMIMDLMLREVLKEIRAAHGAHSSWLSFGMVYSADGPLSRRAYPILGFGMMHPDRQPGLMVPNPFFVSPRWWQAFSNASSERSATRPWATRVPKALFRGACGPGAKARFQLLRVRDETRLDVGFTKADGYATVRECVLDLAKKHAFGRADAARLLDRRVLAQVPQRNYSHYRYLIHMPGSATGSYSRNLQYLWSHGAVVLVWKHEAAEYYYQWLREGVHYLSVDGSTILEQIERVERNTTLRDALLEGAAAFQRLYLSRAALVDRWWSILKLLRERQTQGAMPTIDGNAACTCDEALMAKKIPECTKCEIVHMKDHRLAKFVGVVPKHLAPAQPQ